MRKCVNIICKKYAKNMQNMQIYAQNMQKYAQNMHRICIEYAKNMQNVQKYAYNRQKYSAQFVPQKYSKICKLYACYMQKHATRRRQSYP